jgi:cbb3-type cytochrome oxidase subunit 3
MLDKFGTISLILGILCIVWTLFRKIKFTIYETPKASILIIKNRKHNKIINEIQSRRKKQLLELYSHIDYDNNIKSEIKKFEWLKDEKVLSDKEANEKISKLKENKNERIGFIQ